MRYPYNANKDNDKAFKIKMQIDHIDEERSDAIEATKYWKSDQADIGWCFGMNCWESLRRLFDDKEQFEYCIDAIIDAHECYKKQIANK